ncbi:craniofacial development protein 2-like [Gordionus sp. m RMFG-2023]|uniref:craniofacial development protein 2-like n=1 Tax=Gordionus sp. m RMFG-2023 TaxID=3053472 RepID=UPI0031FC84B1
MIGDGYKLYYNRIVSNRNGLGIILSQDLTSSVTKVNRISDRLMKIKFGIGQSILDIFSVYTPQTCCKEEEKDDFRAILDESVMEILKDDLVIIGGDLNAHVGKARDSYKRHHGGFGYGERNDEGEHVLKFTKAFDLALTNTYDKKKDSHLITYESGTRKTQIDYMLISRRRLKDVIDCKVIPGEDIASQHKLLVMDLHLTNSTRN